MEEFMIAALLWMCVGIALGGIGLVYGMLPGLAVGMIIKKEKE